MARPSSLQPDADQGILDGLFAHPPVSQAELQGRLEMARPPRLRELLVERLSEDRISAEDTGILLAVFERIGVAEARPALLALVADGSRAAHIRARALTVLMEDDPANLDRLLGRMCAREVTLVAEQWVAELLGAIQADPRQGEVLAETLEAASAGLRPFLFDRVESLRRLGGTSAAAAYGWALRRPGLEDLHGRMMAAVVEEARPDGVALLEELWRQTRPGWRSRELQGAVFRARTRRIEAQTGPAPRGRAYLGSCDGQGAFILVACFENPDSSLTIADLCVRAGAEVRDGFLLPRRVTGQCEELLEEISRDTGIAFAPLALEQAAALVREAAARTQELGIELPPDARPAVQLFDRLAGQPLELPDGGGGWPKLEEMEALLSRPEYEHSWFFDRGDLQAAGLELPSGPVDLRSWAVQAAGRLARPSLRARLVAMAAHMARWHRAKGEAELAALCAAAGRATEEDFARSPLVLAMLERSVVSRDEERSAGPELDRQMLRQHLKGLFFGHISAPRGRDLARLDFTEAALVFMEEALLGLPGERRPREHERTTAAFAIGKLFADFLIAGARGSIEGVIDDMHRALQTHCQLEESECRRVVAVVLPSLGDYIEQHCTNCPVACLDRPAAEVAEAFFAPHHPVGTRGDSSSE